MDQALANDLVMRLITLIFTILGIVIGGGLLTLLTILVKTLINNHNELVLIRDKLNSILEAQKPIPKLHSDVNHLYRLVKGVDRPQEKGVDGD